MPTIGNIPRHYHFDPSVPHTTRQGDAVTFIKFMRNPHAEQGFVAVWMFVENGSSYLTDLKGRHRLRDVEDPWDVGMDVSPNDPIFFHYLKDDLS